MEMGKGVMVFCVWMAFNVMFDCIVTDARAPATYNVGDGDGWSPTVPMETWPRGKHFFAGDILVFKYDYQLYDVVVDDKQGYDTCTVSANSTTYESGYDKVRLDFGNNYFIASNQDDCQSGMKMAIYAAAPPTLR